MAGRQLGRQAGRQSWESTISQWVSLPVSQPISLHQPGLQIEPPASNCLGGRGRPEDRLMRGGGQMEVEGGG